MEEKIRRKNKQRNKPNNIYRIEETSSKLSIYIVYIYCCCCCCGHYSLTHLTEDFDAQNIGHNLLSLFVQVRMYQGDVVVTRYAVTQGCAAEQRERERKKGSESG